MQPGKDSRQDAGPKARSHSSCPTHVVHHPLCVLSEVLGDILLLHFSRPAPALPPTPHSTPGPLRPPAIHWGLSLGPADSFEAVERWLQELKSCMANSDAMA